MKVFSFLFRSRRWWGFVGVTALLGAAAMLYAEFNPAEWGFFPRCLFRSATGWQCPGCGSQRALHQLLHGNLAAAFRFNAYLVLMLPLTVLLLFVHFFRHRFPRLYNRLNSRPLILFLLFATLAWWLGRNIWGV